MHDITQTIIAPASANGPGARAIVRVSGPQTVAFLRQIAELADFDAQRPSIIATEVVLTPTGAGQARMPGVRLPVEVWLWPTARSYTRQPLAEIHLPGSPPLVELLLARLTDAGAWLAQPGEFTLRAYLAGRLDLLQAEAVLGLIDARDDSSFHAALAQLAGGFSAPLEQLRSDLMDLLADLEAGLDFVDEDLEFVSNDEIQRRLAEAEAQIAALLQRLASRDAADRLPRVVLLGSPNAGKSQLFNTLVNDASAIVSPIAGTTRDYLRGRCDCDGMLVELIDTAGIEEAVVEESSPASLAQEKTASQLDEAELLLHCVDLSSGDSTDVSSISITKQQTRLLIVIGTKVDLPRRQEPSPGMIVTSARTGDGLAELRREIAARLQQRPGEIMASSAARCRSSLAAALTALRDASERAKFASQDEWLAADLRAALAELGQVTGAVQTNDLLDRIFSRFCIGK